eukprot:2792070-Pleurochrysis_carterae.AAC.1
MLEVRSRVRESEIKLSQDCLGILQAHSSARPAECCSQRGKPSTEHTPRVDVRGADKLSAPALLALMSDCSVAN